MDLRSQPPRELSSEYGCPPAKRRNFEGRRSSGNTRIAELYEKSEENRFYNRASSVKVFPPSKPSPDNDTIQSSDIFASENKDEETVASIRRNDDEQQWLQYKDDRPPNKAPVELLENVRRTHEDELYRKHTNLNFISGSFVECGKHGGQNRYCLVLYCTNKGVIPDGEEPFPKSLHFEGNDIDVDVREGSRMIPMMDREASQSDFKHETVKMGTRIRRIENSKEESKTPLTFNSGKLLKKKDIQEIAGRDGKVHPLIFGSSLGSKIGRLHHEEIAGSTRLRVDGVKHIMKEVHLVTSFRKPFICLGESGSGVFVEHKGEIYCIGIAIACQRTACAVMFLR